MSRKGGYKIIDLKGLDLTKVPEIKGIYKAIKSNYEKPLLFTGIVVNGVKKDDIFSQANVSIYSQVGVDIYEVNLHGLTYSIASDDMILLKESTSTFINLGDDENAILNLPNGLYAVILKAGVEYKFTKLFIMPGITDGVALNWLVQPYFDRIGEVSFDVDMQVLMAISDNTIYATDTFEI